MAVQENQMYRTRMDKVLNPLTIFSICGQYFRMVEQKCNYFNNTAF